MIKVHINDDSQEAFDKGIKKFLKYCNKDGFLREIRDRRYFKKPSQKRHEKEISLKRERERNKQKRKRKY